MAAVVSTLIELDEQGVAWISGTRTKVIEVALDKLAHGSSPEEIHLQYPHLSLAQIHAAFAYYYDHQAELDAAIQRSVEEYDKIRKEQGESPLVAKLRAMGKLP